MLFFVYCGFGSRLEKDWGGGERRNKRRSPIWQSSRFAGLSRIEGEESRVREIDIASESTTPSIR